MTITAETLRAALEYDAETGVFTRKVKAGKRWPAGGVVGTTNKDGYRQVNLQGRIYFAHRLAWLYVTGHMPVNQIDHINGDKADNRFANLRDVDGSTNCQNLRRARGETRTGALGVSVVSRAGASRPYRAQIVTKDGRQSLGCHETLDAAKAAYLNGKRRLHAGCTI